MIYDLFMLAIVGFMAWRGSQKGIAWQLAAIGSIILCFLFSTPLSLELAPLIHVDPPLSRWLAMLASYIIFSFVCFAGARMLRGVLEDMKFQEFDQHLGGVFGAIKGILLCFVGTFFIVCISPQNTTYVLSSRSGYLSAVLMRQIEVVLPKEVETVLRPYANKFEAGVAAAQPEARPALGNFEQPLGTDVPPADQNPSDFRGSPRAPEHGRGHGYQPIEAPAPSRETPGSDTSGNTPVPAPAPAGGGIGSWLNGFSDSIGKKISGGIAGAFNDAIQGNGDGTPSTTQAAPNAGPDSRPAEPEMSTAETNHEFRLIGDDGHALAKIFSSEPEAQTRFLKKLVPALDGIPLPVVERALSDWRVDLSGEGTDPDPQTDATTSLPARVLAAARHLGTDTQGFPEGWQQRCEAATGE